MLTRDAGRTTSESFGVRRIACIVPVWATTQRTLLTCGAPLPNEAALQAAKKRGSARAILVSQKLPSSAGLLAKHAELPILQSSRFYLAINLKSAVALGVALPVAFTARADEVIE